MDERPDPNAILADIAHRAAYYAGVDVVGIENRYLSDLFADGWDFIRERSCRPLS